MSLAALSKDSRPVALITPTLARAGGLATSITMTVDPTVVGYDLRVEAGHASIKGVSLEPRWRSLEVGEKLPRFRTGETLQAIHASLDEVRRTGY